MGIELFYPAPEGLPVPVRPARGNDSLRQIIEKTDWRTILNIGDDGLVRTGALWLHGFLEEAHALAQKNSSREGSYWHALVHRSEGDFDNSLYWYSRVGEHPIFPKLRVEVETMRQAYKATASFDALLAEPGWKPHRLVELCREARAGRSADLLLLQGLAAVEFNFLMGHVLDLPAGR